MSLFLQFYRRAIFGGAGLSVLAAAINAASRYRLEMMQSGPFRDPPYGGSRGG
jgi:hypothetical protein